MRIAILSDIHANNTALQEVLKHARTKSVEQYWFLGDGVGYGPHPIEVLEFWQTLLPESWVPGNHDAGLVGVLSEHAFNEHAQTALRLNREQLQGQRPELLAWLFKSIPPSETWVRRHVFGEDLYLLSHGALCRGGDPVQQLMLSIKPWLRNAVLRQLELVASLRGKTTGRSIVFLGHTHIPCFWNLNGRHNGEPKMIRRPITWGEPMPISSNPTLINPGSVGQPRDGDRRASYAILDVEVGEIAFYRIEYSVRLTQRAMRGYPDSLRERLMHPTLPDDWPPGWVV